MFTFDWRILKLKSHFWYVVIANIDFCNGSTFSRRLNQGRAILHASSLLVTIRSFIIRLFNSLMLLSGLKEAFALLFVPLYRPIAKMLFIFFFLSFLFLWRCHLFFFLFGNRQGVSSHRHFPRRRSESTYRQPHQQTPSDSVACKCHRWKRSHFFFFLLFFYQETFLFLLFFFFFSIFSLHVVCSSERISLFTSST